MLLKKYIYKLRGMILLLLLIIVPHLAHANCTANPSMPYLQTMNNMAVAVNLGIGETIPGTVRYYQFSGKCDPAPPAVQAGSPIISCYYGSGTEVIPGVYSTGVAGIGIRLRNAAGQPMVNASGVWCDTRSANLGNLNPDLTYSISVSVEFVKTASTIATGNLDPAQTRFGFGVYQGSVAGALGGASNYIGFSGSAAPRQITCNVNYPTSVTLPNVGASSLSTPDTTARMAPFAIGLQCSGAALVGITFDGAAGTPVKSATTGVLGTMNEDAAGVARGVGVQLVNGTTLAPMPLRVRNDLGSITANVASSYKYALRYYRLAGTLAAGTVHGGLVFTFDYQ